MVKISEFQDSGILIKPDRRGVTLQLLLVYGLELVVLDENLVFLLVELSLKFLILSYEQQSLSTDVNSVLMLQIKRDQALFV